MVIFYDPNQKSDMNIPEACVIYTIARKCFFRMRRTIPFHEVNVENSVRAFCSHENGTDDSGLKTRTPRQKEKI